MDLGSIMTYLLVVFFILLLVLLSMSIAERCYSGQYVYLGDVDVPLKDDEESEDGAVAPDNEVDENIDALIFDNPTNKNDDPKRDFEVFSHREIEVRNEDDNSKQSFNFADDEGAVINDGKLEITNKNSQREYSPSPWTD